MRNRNSTIAYVIFGLIAIGVLVSIFSRPGKFILPLLVFGFIFLLYKFPPSRWGGFNRKSGPARHRKSKNAKFRVIRGNKDDSNEPPKYH